MPYSALIVTLLGVVALIPRFVAQGYAISRGLSGANYLLLSLAVSTFSPYFFGLLCARVTDSLARNSANCATTKPLFSFSVVIMYSYLASILALPVVIIFYLPEIVLAIIVGGVSGIANQALTLQQAYFLEKNSKVHLIAQQSVGLVVAVVIYLSVVWYKLNILTTMMYASTFLATLSIAMQWWHNSSSLVFVNFRRVVGLVKCSLFPLTYVAATAVFLIYISAERFLADLYFPNDLKKYFFLLNGYLVLSTVSARVFRYTSLRIRIIGIAAATLAASIVIVIGLRLLFGVFPYSEEFVLVWGYPFAAVISWRLFQEFRAARLYKRALNFFIGLTTAKLVLLAGLGMEFHGIQFEIASQFVYAGIFFAALRELARLPHK